MARTRSSSLRQRLLRSYHTDTTRSRSVAESTSYKKDIEMKMDSFEDSLRTLTLTDLDSVSLLHLVGHNSELFTRSVTSHCLLGYLDTFFENKSRTYSNTQSIQSHTLIRIHLCGIIWKTNPAFLNVTLQVIRLNVQAFQFQSACQLQWPLLARWKRMCQRFINTRAIAYTWRLS